jgi:hypothetical protein
METQLQIACPSIFLIKGSIASVSDFENNSIIFIPNFIKFVTENESIFCGELCNEYT